MIPTDLHTTDLTAACPKSVELRLHGRVIPQGTGALFFGNLWHAAVKKLYEAHGTPTQCVMDAMPEVIAAMKEEGRELTKATEEGRHEDAATIIKWLTVYSTNYMIDGEVHLEVPCRITLEVDGEPQNFASHIDLLQVNSRVLVRDWKSQEESPTPAFLSRNLQLGLYWLMVRYGQVMIGGEWVRIGKSPTVQWLHVRSLNPYGKATEATDENGQKRKYAKGEARPYGSVVKTIVYADEQESAIIEALATRVRMFRAGLHPAIPDPVGCFVCESNQFCPSFGGVV